MDIGVEQLLIVIGELEIKRRLLEAELARLKKEQDDSSGDASRA